MAEQGIDITEEFPKPWTDEIVRAADVVITMGCGDACPVFPGKRYEDWTLEDPAGQGVEDVRPIRDDIERRVRLLLAELGVPVASGTVTAATLPRRLLAELVGTGLLVTVVVGSGIAAQRLSPDDVGLQLLENSTATAFGLAVLILMFGPVSGAHFNPVVSAVDWLLGRRAGTGLAGREVRSPTPSRRRSGGIGGALLANAMYAGPMGHGDQPARRCAPVAR